jgi:hypothetical protein
MTWWSCARLNESTASRLSRRHDHLDGTHNRPAPYNPAWACPVHGARCRLLTAVGENPLHNIVPLCGFVPTSRWMVGVEPEVSEGEGNTANGRCVGPRKPRLSDPTPTETDGASAPLGKVLGLAPGTEQPGPLGWLAGLGNPRHRPQTRVPQIFQKAPVQCRFNTRYLPFDESDGRAHVQSQATRFCRNPPRPERLGGRNPESR